MGSSFSSCPGPSRLVQLSLRDCLHGVCWPLPWRNSGTLLARGQPTWSTRASNEQWTSTRHPYNAPRGLEPQENHESRCVDYLKLKHGKLNSPKLQLWQRILHLPKPGISKSVIILLASVCHSAIVWMTGMHWTEHHPKMEGRQTVYTDIARPKV
jgi:hypothetical protein